VARDIFEEQEITVKVTLKRGQPQGTDVKFTFKGDDKTLKEESGTLDTSDGNSTGSLATCKYKTAKVDADKPSYLLTYSVKAAGDDYPNADEFRVWPRKLKLTAVKKSDGSTPLKGFKCKVMQGGQQTGKDLKLQTDDAKIEVNLAKGSGFTVEALAPYEMTDPPTGPLRDLKLKGELKFTAEFVKPTGTIVKQYVNLVSGADGQDGMGNKVVVQVGAKGDRADTSGGGGDDSMPFGSVEGSSELIGGPGVFVYIQVDFDPTRDPVVKKSKRNSPKPDLLAGKNLSDRTVVTADKKFKGKVELALAGGVGEFELELGKAGGDRCEIKIGGTDACSDATLTFENWRKIYYELMAPDFLDLPACTLPDNTPGRDFNPTGKGNLTTQGNATYIEYELYKTQSFTSVEATTAGVKGAMYKRAFFELTTGPDDIYLLTDYTFTKYPKAFDKGKAARGTLIKMCNVNLYNDGPGGDADKTMAVPFTATPGSLNITDTLGVYWSPVSAYSGGAGADAVRSIEWTADIDPNFVKSKPDVTFDPNVTGPDEVGKDRTITVRETVLGSTHNIKFLNPLIGNTATDVSQVEQDSLDSWLLTVCTQPNMKTTGNKVNFELTGMAGNERQLERFTNSSAALIARVTAVSPSFAIHPGLDDSENPVTGNLPLSVIDMAASTYRKMVINLPATAPGDPGSFVGPTTTFTTCRINVTVVFEPQHGGRGLAGQGAQKGELLMVYAGAVGAMCDTDTMLHELGHQYNMSAYNQATDTHAPGMPKPKSTAEDETVDDYKNVGAKGHYYDRHGHAGPHCAWGLTDTNKALASYGSKGGICTMFGEGASQDTSRTRSGFCPQCIDYIRARDLSALK
jgi:hypothetical protein